MPQKTASLVVWVDSREHIASFHCVEGYERMDFSEQEFFTSYLQSLVERGYHFM